MPRSVFLGCGSSGASAASEAPRQVFVANALGMVVADSTLCVGCRRCEAACVAYNQGIVQPSISNVKVSRNQQFGVAGVSNRWVSARRWRFWQLPDRPGYLPPMPAPGALSVGLPAWRHRGHRTGQRQGGKCCKMRRVRHLRAGLPLGNDIPERTGKCSGYKGEQVHSLQWHR